LGHETSDFINKNGASDMSEIARNRVLTETFWQADGAAIWLKRAVLVVAGVLALAIAAKIAVPVWPSPVPITLGTFAVLTIGAAYGPRLGLATILAYMALGALGWDVFAGSSAEANGLSYMAGSTGGYLLGYVLATLALGFAARRGLDRSVGGMALAMLLGTALIYIPGVLWLGVLYGWNEPILAWGLTPFLIGDAIKLALAALVVPALWKLVGTARS
jgi:biotin transport system substrate-specific component